MEPIGTPNALLFSCSTNGLNERSPTEKLPKAHLQEHPQTLTKMCRRKSETLNGHSEPRSRLREKRNSPKDEQNWNPPRRSCLRRNLAVSASALPWLSVFLFLLLTTLGQSVSAQKHQAKVDSPHCSYTLVVNEFDVSKCPVMQADAQPGAAAQDFKQLRHHQEDPLAKADPARFQAAASAGGGNPKLSSPWASVSGSPDKERDVGVLKSQVRDLEERLVQEMVVSRQMNNTVGRHDRALGQAERQLAHYQANFTQLYRALVFVQRQLKRQRKVNKSLNQKVSNVMLDVVEVNNVLTRVPTSSRDGAKATAKTFHVQSVSKVRSCPGVTDQSPTYLDCAAVFEAGHRQSGVYYVRPRAAACPVPVWCDMDTPPGGWLLFQKRQDGSVSFNRPWDVYRDGFGSVAGEHWLGNDNLFLLTNQAHYQLRVDLWDFSGNRVHAVYTTFRVAGERDKFQLTISGFTGSAQDSLHRHNRMAFSTPDRDNDARGESHCAAEWEAGWWFNDCWFALLNGAYHNRSDVQYRGIAWNHWKRQQLRKTEMKMRPITVKPKA